MPSVEKNIALIGMMGCMKTSAGKAFSELTGKSFFDTDEIYEQCGETISHTFETRGEQFFRVRETEIFTRLCMENRGAVISCGGGLPMIEKNRNILSECFVVWLTASGDEICRRLVGDNTRPLLSGDMRGKVFSLLVERTPVYKSVADAVVATDGRTPKEVAKEMERVLRRIAADGAK